MFSKTSKLPNLSLEERKELIMSTALKIFSEKGFHSTSIRQISKKAGISVGVVYNYFKSKDDLLFTILQKGVSEIFSITNEFKNANNRKLER